jgi:NAD-dependent deacetylase
VDDSIRRAVDVLSGARRILIFTGAGISVESGISDFRGPDGLWSRVDPSLFEIGRYLTDADARKQVWRVHLSGELSVANILPNAAHLALVDLWATGMTTGCITQNVDGLHTKAGLPDGAVAELHGDLAHVECVACKRRWPAEEIIERLAAGDDDPHCTECGGILKSTTVLFGELLPGAAIARARQMSDTADAVLAVGSTLSVYPAVDFVLDPVFRGAPLVIANLGPTDYDRLATVRVDGPAATTIPSIVQGLLASS